MAKRTLSLVLLIVGGLAASLGARGETEEAPSRPSPPKEPGYVGDRVCMRCHFAQHKSWAATAHARATRVLLPGQAASKKAAADLDPRKDYTKDPDCLQCHTTGYGESGGYPAPPSSGSWSREERLRASRTAGVSCEACHGAGSRFTVVMDKNPRFRREEIVAAGAQIPVPSAVCAGCHGEPCAVVGRDDEFDAERERNGPAIHAHVPLRFPH